MRRPGWLPFAYATFPLSLDRITEDTQQHHWSLPLLFDPRMVFHHDYFSLPSRDPSGRDLDLSF
jgi:hypothetical protein